MALSEATINFNYNKAMAKAAELDAAAAKLDSDGVQELESISGSIKKDWEGKSSGEYIAKCNKEKQNLAQLVSDMKKTASAMRTMAENIKQAELKALAIARAAAAAAKAAAEGKK